VEILIIIPFITAMTLPPLLKDDNIGIKTIYGHETSSLTLKGENTFLILSTPCILFYVYK
jgi:hypothetical protein